MSRSLSKKARFEVFKRDSFTCRYCGATPPKLLEVDHIKPVCKGGSDDPMNLITACFDCNRGKAGIELDDLSFSKKAWEIAERESEIMEQSEAYEKMRSAKRRRLKSQTKKACDYWTELSDGSYSIAPKGKISIKKFIEKMGLDDVLDSMEIAFSRVGAKHGTYRYFCGVCHHKTREREGGEG